MIYVVYKDGSWNETESDLEAAEYAGSKIWLVTIRGSRLTPRALDASPDCPHLHTKDHGAWLECLDCGETRQ